MEQNTAFSSQDKVVVIAAAFFVAIALFFLYPSSSTKSSEPVVPEGDFCDATHSCPSGSDCYKFQNKDAPICFSGNPCSVCPSQKCLAMESYPVQIKCQ